MTPETVQTLLRETFRMMNAGGEITFSFQGPEPTRAGIEFYREFVRLARESCPSGCYLFWSIQTQGVDLDKAWMNLFSK